MRWVNMYYEAVIEYTNSVDKHERNRLLARHKLVRGDLLNNIKIGKENIRKYQDLTG